jgi:predicted Zn-dependent protease
MNDLADTYLQVGQVEQAIEMAQRATATDPTLDLAWATLAQALRTAGRTTEAQQAEQHARQLEEQS